jgi:hypothetical protein
MILYNCSIYTMLSTLFPEHNWQPFRFPKVPAYTFKKVLEDKQMRSEYVDFLIEDLSIQSKEDWYKVSSEKLQHRKSFDWRFAFSETCIF